MPNKFNQEEVLSRLANGDELAFEQVFNHYYPKLHNFCFSFLKNEEGINDVLQEIFVKIWENRGKIIYPNTFNAYIFTIARNLILNEIRRLHNNEKLKSEVFKKSVAEEFLLSEEVEFIELKEKIDKIIEELPSRQKEVFFLSRMDGLSNKEIAEQLKITTKTVEYHIHQSLNFIKERLKSFGLFSMLYLILFFNIS